MHVLSKRNVYISESVIHRDVRRLLYLDKEEMSPAPTARPNFSIRGLNKLRCDFLLVEKSVWTVLMFTSRRIPHEKRRKAACTRTQRMSFSYCGSTIKVASVREKTSEILVCETCPPGDVGGAIAVDEDAALSECWYPERRVAT